MSVSVIKSTTESNGRTYVSIEISVARRDKTYKIYVDPRDGDHLMAELARVLPEAKAEQAPLLAAEAARKADRPERIQWAGRAEAKPPAVRAPGKTARDKANRIAGGERHPTNVGNPSPKGKS